MKTAVVSFLSGSVLSAFTAINLITPVKAQEFAVESQRALKIWRIQGQVTYLQQGNQKGPAQVGFLLQAPGEGILTGTRSYAILLIDTNIGRLNVSENSDLRVKGLQITSNGGRVTLLSLLKGQVRQLVRPFNNPDSRLEIETPAGVVGVRGTEFGVGVGPTGKTNLATLEGEVTASAQGQTVLVGKGFGSTIVPGEPPTPPRLLTDDVSLRLIWLRRTSLGTVEVVGRVDPFNLVWIDDRDVDVSKDGKFATTFPIPSNYRFKIRIQSPLGKDRSYSLLVP